MQWDANNVLTKATHTKSTVEADLPDEFPITKKWDLKQFWSDGDAVAKVGTMRSTHIISFFEAKLKTNRLVLGYPLGVNGKRFQNDHAKAIQISLDTVTARRTPTIMPAQLQRAEELKVKVQQQAAAAAKKVLDSNKVKAMASVATRVAKRKLDDI